MKKNIIIAVSIICITLIVGTVVYFKTNNNYSKKETPKENMLSIMIESEDVNGVKKYTEYEGSTFPTDGYLLNEEKSGCEKGGVVTWNNETKKVVIKSNSSDKCYAYFDKLPEVTNE